MKSEKILLFFSIIGILILIFISQTTTPSHIDKIKTIQKDEKKIIIKLENSTTELILFNKEPIKIEIGDIIKYQGKKETYKNKEQIIVDKIIKL